MTTAINDFNDLYIYMRKSTHKWKKDSLRAGNNRCCITGNVHDLEVHHLTRNYKDIMRETFAVTGLPEGTKTDQYTIGQLNLLLSVCEDIHRRAGLGVILSSRMHRQLHMELGYGPITQEQFRAFKAKYKKRKAA